jgi:hypothetical protein
LEIIDFQNKRWVVKTREQGNRVDDPTQLKNNYNCDLVLRDKQGMFLILDEIIDAEFEEI